MKNEKFIFFSTIWLGLIGEFIFAKNFEPLQLLRAAGVTDRFPMIWKADELSEISSTALAI